MKNKLLVPIYFKFGTTVGYNDNVFKFSDSEKNNSNSYNYMGNSINYDSSIIKPEFRILYSPKIFKNNTSNFIFFASSSNYSSVIDKNGLYLSFRFEYKIGSYNWLKVSYKSTRNNFLRYYLDADVPTDEYLKCDYDSESLLVSYSVNLKKYGWLRFGLSSGSQFFNPNFTEFDLDINRGELKYYFNIKDFNASILLWTDIAKNTTYANGLSSTAFDRSYKSSALSFKISKKINRYFEKLNIEYRFGNRSYLSESLSDPLHSGRSHFEQSFSASILKELRNDISLELKYKVRFRRTDSEFDWVETLKTFSDNQIMVKMTYYTEMDLFY